MGTETYHAAIEREVQRRLTDILASAGVSQGRLSLECLYMLPPDFIRLYRELFDAALKEEVSHGESDPYGQTALTRRVTNEPLRSKDQTKGRTASGKLTTEVKKVGVYNRGGTRFRQHWIIRNERAFRAKGSIDRKLLRLTQEIQGLLEECRRADDER